MFLFSNMKYSEGGEEEKQKRGQMRTVSPK